MGESPAQLLEFSVMPIAKVLIMCLLGLLMASKYVDIFPLKSRRQLSKMVFTVFLPCLIFTELGSAVTFQKVLQWWFIPLNVVISNILGCGLGFIVALIIRPPKEFFKFTVVFIGIGNIGNVPLVLLGAICHDPKNPFGTPDQCNTDSIAYISMGQWVGAVVVYTFVFHMLAPPKNHDESSNGESIKLDMSTPLLSAPDGGNIQSISKQRSCMGGCMEVVKNILQPPVIASILALIIGTIPPLKNVLFSDSAPLYFLSDALNLLGEAMIPCIMLCLGGNLIKGPGRTGLGLKTTVVITVVRLAVIPLIGIGVVKCADILGFLPPNNKMFRFVLLLQHSMPSSILAGAVTSVIGYAEQEASAILFWEHIIAMFSMAGWLAVHIQLLFTYNFI